MGMFDSVFARCPKCGQEVEFQSKAGNCDMKRYSTASVPAEIGRDIDGSGSKCKCGNEVRVRLTKPVERVQMIVSSDDDEQWD